MLLQYRPQVYVLCASHGRMVQALEQGKKGERMSKFEAIPNIEENIKIIQDYIIFNHMSDFPKIQKAMEDAVDALWLIDQLKDRPCAACKFHKQNGCSQWECVFDDMSTKEMK